MSYKKKKRKDQIIYKYFKYKYEKGKHKPRLKKKIKKIKEEIIPEKK